MMEDSQEIEFKTHAGGAEQLTVDSGMGETRDHTQLLQPEVTLTEDNAQSVDTETIRPSHTSKPKSPEAPLTQTLLKMYSVQKKNDGEIRE